MKFELFYPIKPAKINQNFGGNSVNYSDPKYGGIVGHNGIDFQASHGDPVYAAHDGTCYPEIDSSGGNGVVIRTDDAYEYEGAQVHFKTIYWHLDKADAVVKIGQKVKTGDLIGYADNTGASTGDHLHFGLKAQAWDESNWTWYNLNQNNGYLGAIDPAPYFNGYYATDASTVFFILNSIKNLLTSFLKQSTYPQAKQ